VADHWNDPGTMDGYTVGALATHVPIAIAPLEPMLDKPAPVF
jgi:hypothetical protein